MGKLYDKDGKFLGYFQAENEGLQRTPVPRPKHVLHPEEKAGRSEWDNIIREIVMDLKEERREWFDACCDIFKDDPGARSNPQFAEEAEVLTIVIQCAKALELVAMKQYVPPESGREFANLLLFDMAIERNLGLAHKFYARHLKVETNIAEMGELMELCQLVGECILNTVSGKQKLAMAGMLPLFANVTSQAVARAFNDSETLRDLEQRA